MKKVIIIAFAVLIIASAIFVNGIFIVDSDEDDIFGDSLSLFFQILFNIFILVPELDWFYNIMYFVSDKKQKNKTILNIMAGICSAGMLVSFLFFDLFLKQAEVFIILFLLIYILIRIIYIFTNLLNRFLKRWG